MKVEEQKVRAVLRHMAEEPHWKPGLSRRTLLRARARRSLTVGLAVVLILSLAYGTSVLAAAFTSPHRTAAARPVGKIVFAGRNGIYVIDANGSHLRQVTHSKGDTSPSWSPDGRTIVFQRYTSGRSNIYVINARGGGLRRLTSDGRSGEPVWSPTGDEIAFTREFPTHRKRMERIRIFLMRTDGSATDPATRDPFLEYETSPAWSPDGKRIVFAGFNPGQDGGPPTPGGLYIARIGARPQPVGPAHAGAAAGDDFASPAWSPTGQSLLFVSGASVGGTISVMSSTGLHAHALLPGHGLSSTPAWSPDGHTVVFSRGATASSTLLYLLDLNTGGVHPLTPPSVTPASDPAWWAPSPSVPPSPASSPQAHTEKLVATAHIHVAGGISDVAVGPDAVWVAGVHSLIRIDPTSGSVMATIPLPGVGEYSSIALGEGAVWVTGSERSFYGLYKVDPRANRLLDRIPLAGYPQGVAVGGGTVWVTRPNPGVGTGNLVRIDPQTDRVFGKPIHVGAGPSPAVYANGALFVTSSDYGGSVSKVDARTGQVIYPWTTARRLQAFGAGSLWGIQGNFVTRVDPDSGRMIARIPLNRAAAVTFADGRVWAITDPRSKSGTLYIPDLHHPGVVVTIDPSTNRVVSNRVPYGETAAYIDVRGNVAWIGDFNREILTRVDLTKG